MAGVDLLEPRRTHRALYTVSYEVHVPCKRGPSWVAGVTSSRVLQSLYFSLTQLISPIPPRILLVYWMELHLRCAQGLSGGGGVHASRAGLGSTRWPRVP